MVKLAEEGGDTVLSYDVDAQVGGKIELVSAPGEQTAFRIRIPVAPSEGTPHGTHAEAASVAQVQA